MNASFGKELSKERLDLFAAGDGTGQFRGDGRIEPELADVEQRVHHGAEQMPGIVRFGSGCDAVRSDWPMTCPIFSPPPARSSGVSSE